MKQKLLVAALALTLVLCLALGGTLAWLTSRTKSIVNTFVIGKKTDGAVRHYAVHIGQEHFYLFGFLNKKSGCKCAR